MITVKNVIESMERAVEEYGRDYVDPNSMTQGICKNVFVDEYGKTRYCIAAYVLRDLDIVAEETLQTYNSSYVGAVLSHAYALDDVSVVAQELLLNAQARQDDGEPWGNVLDMAKNDDFGY